MVCFFFSNENLNFNVLLFIALLYYKWTQLHNWLPFLSFLCFFYDIFHFKLIIRTVKWMSLLVLTLRIWVNFLTTMSSQCVCVLQYAICFYLCVQQWQMWWESCSCHRTASLVSLSQPERMDSSSAANIYTCVHLRVRSFMEAPLFPRESGQFIAERSKDVCVQEEGVQKVAEMLYSLRHTDHLNATGWKKANPLAPVATSDQVRGPEFMCPLPHYPQHCGHFPCRGGCFSFHWTGKL